MNTSERNAAEAAGSLKSFKMTKTVISKFRLLLILSMAAVGFSSCGEEKEEEYDGVVINGVKWATSNVDAPGTFAANPEDAGMFYQWNTSKEYAVTGTIDFWNINVPTGTSWEAANDPCPVGYRVPTAVEIDLLLDTVYVTNEWTVKNGIRGRIFTEKATGNSIFLPAVGSRAGSKTLRDTGTVGYYWTGKQIDSSDAYFLKFSSSNAQKTSSNRTIGYSIRPVVKK